MIWIEPSLKCSVTLPVPCSCSLRLILLTWMTSSVFPLVVPRVSPVCRSVAISLSFLSVFHLSSHSFSLSFIVFLLYDKHRELYKELYVWKTGCSLSFIWRSSLIIIFKRIDDITSSASLAGSVSPLHEILFLHQLFSRNLIELVLLLLVTPSPVSSHEGN